MTDMHLHFVIFCPIILYPPLINVPVGRATNDNVEVGVDLILQGRPVTL